MSTDPAGPTSTPAPTVGTPERTFNQADVDRMIQDRLARDRAARPTLSDAEIQQLRERAARADELEKGQQDQVQRLEQERDQARARVQELEPTNHRLTVALEKGLVGDRAWIADRLRGSSLEELRADADDVLQRFPAPQPTPPEAQPTGEPTGQQQPPAQQLAPTPSDGGAGQPVPDNDDEFAKGYMQQHFPAFAAAP